VGHRPHGPQVRPSGHEGSTPHKRSSLRLESLRSGPQGSRRGPKTHALQVRSQGIAKRASNGGGEIRLKIEARIGPTSEKYAHMSNREAPRKGVVESRQGPDTQASGSALFETLTIIGPTSRIAYISNREVPIGRVCLSAGFRRQASLRVSNTDHYGSYLEIMLTYAYARCLGGMFESFSRIAITSVTCYIHPKNSGFGLNSKPPKLFILIFRTSSPGWIHFTEQNPRGYSTLVFPLKRFPYHPWVSVISDPGECSSYGCGGLSVANYL
jgi:hypothetical protein